MDAIFATNNQQMNRIVYSKLVIETVGVPTHHMVKCFKDKKDSNYTLESIYKCYDGSFINNDTEESLM